MASAVAASTASVAAGKGGGSAGDVADGEMPPLRVLLRSEGLREKKAAILSNATATDDQAASGRPVAARDVDHKRR